MIDFQKDKAIIGAATDGPWSQHITYVQDNTGETSVAEAYDSLEDAKYIANFNPAKMREYHDYIGALKVGIGFAEINLNHKSTLLSSCESALEGRDATIAKQAERINDLLYDISELESKEDDAILMAQALNDIYAVIGGVKEVKGSFKPVEHIVDEYKNRSLTTQSELRGG